MICIFCNKSILAKRLSFEESNSIETVVFEVVVGRILFKKNTMYDVNVLFISIMLLLARGMMEHMWHLIVLWAWHEFMTYIEASIQRLLLKKVKC